VTPPLQCTCIYPFKGGIHFLKGWQMLLAPPLQKKDHECVYIVYTYMYMYTHTHAG